MMTTERHADPLAWDDRKSLWPAHYSSAAIAAITAALFALSGGAMVAQTDTGTREQCYGVALANENDGKGSKEEPGGSTRDYQGDAWVWVPLGKCLVMPLPDQSDGTPRRGSLEALDRDRT